MNVLFHIDQKEKWPILLANVTNMLRYGEEHKETYNIEIVVNSVAVQALTQCGLEKNKYHEELQILHTNGVFICACRNALHASSISTDMLYKFVKIVDAGVIELAKKQHEGYAYIKP